MESQVVVSDLRGAYQPLLKEAKDYTGVRLSPDGKKLALSIATGRVGDIYTYDLTSKTQTKVTTNGGDRPEWSADGARVIFRAGATSSTDGFGGDLWWQKIDGSGAAERVVQRPNADVWEGVMTPDGKSFVIRTGSVTGAVSDSVSGAVSGAKLWTRGVGGDTSLVPLHSSTVSETAMRVSAEGRWLAYTTRVGETREVFVLSMRNPNGARTQISDGGGDAPVWSRDGRRIFYIRGQKLLAASVATVCGLIRAFSVGAATVNCGGGATMRRRLIALHCTEVRRQQPWYGTRSGWLLRYSCPRAVCGQSDYERVAGT